MMENRVVMFSRLSKLHGKLELMLSQVIFKFVLCMLLLYMLFPSE